MENKINIAELLKDCPTGMELDCTMYEDVYFDYVDELNIIYCYIKNEGFNTSITFNQHGTPNSDIKSKCVIFPKGKTTWEGFQRPFKDGDIVFYNDTVAIFKEWGDETLFRTHVTTYLCCDSLIDTNVSLFGKSIRKEIRLATEEEKEKLFKAINDNGYRWNPVFKALEKLPKFKVGDRIKSKISNVIYTIINIKCREYHIKTDDEKYLYQIPFESDINYELVPNKFDINDLVPFESKILVKDNKDDIWQPAIYGCINKLNTHVYTMNNSLFYYYIPYEGNEHLLGTTDDCDDFYKI